MLIEPRDTHNFRTPVADAVQKVYGLGIR